MADLTNQASGAYTYQGASLTTNSNVVTFTKVTPQLTIVKTATPMSVVVGTVVHFTLTLESLVVLNNVTITDLLTAQGFAYITGSAKINGAVQPGFDPNTGMVINVLAQGTNTLTFDATVA
ncbi:MAG: hypothetical protein RSB59_04980 [Clostridia bacterium]